MLASCRRQRLALYVALLLGVLARAAPAHDPFEITTEATLGAQALTLVVTMTRSSAALLAMPEQSPRAFTPDRLAQYEPQLRAAVPGLYRVISNGSTLELRDASVALNPENEVEFRVTYPRPSPGALQLHATGLSRLSEGHGNAVRLVWEQPERVLALEFLNASDPVLEVRLPPQDPGAAVAQPAESPARFWRFLELGFGHILTGYDHLLFLGGLLLACSSLRSMLGLITCFTLAHSFTLGFAVLNRVPPAAGAWVEPLIVASVVFVGLENLMLRGERTHRYLVTFGFGLIHGLGFASALQELSGEGGHVLLALLSFNAGVELGQMLIAALALPLLLALRKSPRGPLLVRAASLAIVSIAGYWLATDWPFA